jgi:cytochrome P450
MKMLEPPPHAAMAFREDPLGFLEKLASNGEPVAPLPFRMHGRGISLVNDPALVARLLSDTNSFRKWHAFSGITETLGRGILTSEDPLHADVRRATQPAFLAGAIEAWTRTMSAMARDAIDTELTPGDCDLHAFFERLTLRVAGRILFELDLDAVAADVLACIADLQRFYDARDYAASANRRFQLAHAQLTALLANVVAAQPDARRKGPVFRMLDENSSISAAQLPEELHSILLAGSVTTAVALAAACHHLANDPPSIPLDDAGLDAVFSEALRLAPPAWMHMREAPTDGTLGSVPYRAGDRFMACAWSLHRHARTFPDPEAFRPERWLDAAERRLPPGAFIPFSTGPRSCLGARFARLEALIVLRALLDRFELRPAPSRPPLKWLPRVTLVPAEGAWVHLSKKS